MKTTLLVAAAALVSVASLIACSAGSEPTGASTSNVTDQVDHMFKRPNGNYDVFCTDGHTDDNVPTSAILANNVCPYDADAGTTNSSSGNSSGNDGADASTNSSSGNDGADASTNSSSGNNGADASTNNSSSGNSGNADAGR